MARMIFVQLPVRDLATSRAFYGGLGFTFNEYSSDDGVLSVVVDDNIVVALNTRNRFAQLVAGDLGDPAKATAVVNCLTTNSRDEVDDLAERALHAGGRPWLPPRDEDGAYSKSFTDPDGNAWQVSCMEPQHVID